LGICSADKPPGLCGGAGEEAIKEHSAKEPSASWVVSRDHGTVLRPTAIHTYCTCAQRQGLRQV
jgi:hypothetical protein